MSVKCTHRIVKIGNEASVEKYIPPWESESSTMDDIDYEIENRRWAAIITQLENANIPIDSSEILTHQQGDNALRDKLMIKYDQYRIPRFTSISYLAYYKSVQREQDAILADRRRNAAENNINFDQLDLRRVPDAKRNIIEDQDTFFGLCPYTDEYSIKIVYKKTVKFQDFAKYIQKYGDSDILSIPDTIDNLLSESFRRGMNKEQIADLFKTFAAEKMTNMKSILESKFASGKYREVFHEMVKRINLKHEKAKIQKALNAIIRKPGMDIFDTSGKLEDLCMQTLGISQPNTDENEKRKTAADFVIRHIPHFINEECNRKYQQWLDKTSGKVLITLSRVQDEIQRIENSGGRYRLKRDRKLPEGLTVNEIFSTQESRAEVHNTESRNLSKSPDKRRRKYSKDRDYKKRPDDKRGRGQRRFRSRTPSRGSSRASSTSSTKGASLNYTATSSNASSRASSADSNGSRGRTPPRSHCYRCGSTEHWANKCWRYPEHSENQCSLCKKKGVLLYHPSDKCRFSNKSSWKSPSTTERNQRKKEIEKADRNKTTKPKNQ